MQNADDLLRQQPPVRLAGQRIEAEQGLSFALMAQRHVPRRLIEIRLEAAVPDAGLFGEQEAKTSSISSSAS